MAEEQRYTLTKKDKAYIDVSLAFTPSPVTGDITILTNDRAINNAIKNIVMTLPSEVAFFRDFGSTTNLYLFDLLNPNFLDFQVPRSVNFWISRSPDLQIPRSPNSQNSRSPDLQIPRFPGP